MARKKDSGPQPVENDGDDLLPVPGAAVPNGKVDKPRKRKARGRPATPPDSDTAIDDDDDEGAADVGMPEMEGLPQNNRRTIELEAQMQARVTGEPIFPYPPELRTELKPQWLRLVNSFPSDHFKVSDIPLMIVYVQCAHDIERQNLLIEEEGEIVVGGRGQAIVNPRCKVRDARIGALMGLATKFRNQPASRVNTENFQGRAQKAGTAAAGAQAAASDEDDLLATPGNAIRPIQTRH